MSCDHSCCCELTRGDCLCVLLLVRRQAPRSSRTATLLPYTTRFRSRRSRACARASRQGDARGRGRSRHTERQTRASPWRDRSEEHTSELQSLMRTSYAVFCLKIKTKTQTHTPHAFIVHQLIQIIYPLSLTITSTILHTPNRLQT